MRLWPALALLLALALAACASSAADPTPLPAATPPPESSGPRPTLPAPELARRVTPDIPAVRKRRDAIAAALAATPPILPLAGLDAEAQHVQAQVLADQRVRGLAYTAGGGDPLLVEVFDVVPTTEGDLTESTSACQGRRCYKTVLYSFGSNSTTTVISDVESGAILDVATLPDVQPDVPPHLAALAVEIARAAPEVQQALQMVPPRRYGDNGGHQDQREQFALRAVAAPVRRSDLPLGRAGAMGRDRSHQPGADRRPVDGCGRVVAPAGH
ncbi:MAG: hypothetical protein HGA45_07575 [Chloroflexales bacterium]|nr:hypothetical protein [Chloroflexales bacterium]